MTAYHEEFIPIFLLGCFVAGLAAVFAGRASGLTIPGTLLCFGILSFWAALFFACDQGYRAWQSIPDPPDEAFSDASVMGAMVLGWIPGGMYCLVIFGLVRGFRRLDRWANPQAFPTAADTASPPDNAPSSGGRNSR